MELNDAIQSALEGKAVLFAGSGFSHGAKNWKDESFKTGKQLKETLAKECGIAQTESDLASVADYYLSLDGHSEESLISFLTDNITLGEIAKHHEILMSLKWKRIYTTNYDQVIEEGAKKNGRLLFPVTVDDPLDCHPKEDVCIHINGSITCLTKETLNCSFKLTDRSYNADTLVGKPWFDFMESDFAAAKAIIVVGFSMQSDIDIKRIIALPQISSKTIFITGPNPDPISKNIMGKYATVEPIGVEGLAERIIEQRKLFKESPVSSSVYSSFIHEHMLPLEKCKTHLADLTGFYYLGITNNAIMQKDAFGCYPNIVYRDAVNAFLSSRNKYKVFLAVSSLGNGKTVFCNLVRNELRAVDVDVFILKRENIDTIDEVESICCTYHDKPIVIIIDDYYQHLNMLKAFRDFGLPSRATFLLTSRISKLTSNYRKLTQMLQIDENNVKPLFLNSLTPGEANSFSDVLTLNKLLPDNMHVHSSDELSKFIKIDCKSYISSVITQLFDSSYIKSELTSLYEKALNDDTTAVSKLAIASLASEVMGLHLSFNDIISLLKIDYIKLRLNESDLICELFSVESDDLKVQSPIIARKILRDVIPVENLLSVLLDLLSSADELYKNNGSYKEFMKAIISHGNYIYWIKNSNSIKEITKFYDELRNLSFFHDNPFYWEQFASVSIDAEDFPTAKQCLNNAFDAATSIPGFVPFQVETVYARYLITKLKHDIKTDALVEGNFMTILMEASNRLTKYYNHPEDEHYHVFNLFNQIVILYKAHLPCLSYRDISIFLERLLHVRDLLATYQSSNECAYFPSTDNWMLNLNEAIELSKNNMKER